MRKFILSLFVIMCSISTANAGITPIEEYVSNFGKRIFDVSPLWNKGGTGGKGNSCANYSGYYSSIRSDLKCDTTPRHPAPGLNCYYCEPCPSEYKYDTTSCSASDYSLSGKCGNKYNTCTCDTTKYPTTTLDSGCPYGFVSDENDYCEDKPSGKKHYKCVRPLCSSSITVKECQAKGDYNCRTDQSNPDKCGDYCDSNGCLSICTYYKLPTVADSLGILSNCKYGCATGKQVKNCSGLCYECKSCPNPTEMSCRAAYGSSIEDHGYWLYHPVSNLELVMLKQCYNDDGCYRPEFNSCEEYGLEDFTDEKYAIYDNAVDAPSKYDETKGILCMATCATEYKGGMTKSECESGMASGESCVKAGSFKGYYSSKSVDCYVRCAYGTETACLQKYDYSLGSGAGTGYNMIHPISGVDVALLNKCFQSTGCWKPMFKTCKELGLENATQANLEKYSSVVEIPARYGNGSTGCIATCNNKYAGSMTKAECESSKKTYESCVKVDRVSGTDCYIAKSCADAYSGSTSSVTCDGVAVGSYCKYVGKVGSLACYKEQACPAGQIPVSDDMRAEHEAMCEQSGGLCWDLGDCLPCDGNTVADGNQCVECFEDSSPNDNHSECLCPAGTHKVTVTTIPDSCTVDGDLFKILTDTTINFTAATSVDGTALPDLSDVIPTLATGDTIDIPKIPSFSFCTICTGNTISVRGGECTACGFTEKANDDHTKCLFDGTPTEITGGGTDNIGGCPRNLNQYQLAVAASGGYCMPDYLGYKFGSNHDDDGHTGGY